MSDYTKSNLGIIKRVPKTEKNKIGVQVTYDISVAKPALVILGGNGTKTERDANWYASRMEKLLSYNNIDKVNIYSIFYYFGSWDSRLDTANMFRNNIYCTKDNKKKRVKISVNQEDQLQSMLDNEPVPRFAQRLFNNMILPRIINKNYEKLDVETAIKNIRKLTILAHSYGSVVIKHLEQIMTNDMLYLEYSIDEIDKIKKQLLVIQHSPTSPLSGSKFTTISFASAQDTKLDFHNKFHDYVCNNYDKLPVCFLPEKHGNIFITIQFKHVPVIEHSLVGITEEKIPVPLTIDGTILFNAERNALIAGIKSSIVGSPIPPVKELVIGSNVNFHSLQKNGERFYSKMLKDLRREGKKRHAEQKKLRDRQK